MWKYYTVHLECFCFYVLWISSNVSIACFLTCLGFKPCPFLRNNRRLRLVFMFCRAASLFHFLVVLACTQSSLASSSDFCSSDRPEQPPQPKMTAEANKEQTFIMVKPDGVQRGLVGEIIKRFEQKGFKLVAMKFMHVSWFFLSLLVQSMSTCTIWFYHCSLHFTLAWKQAGFILARYRQTLSYV